LSFDLAPGTLYRIEYKDDLNAPLWTSAGGEQAAGGGTVVVTNDMGAHGQRFFRLVLTP
jgi:hypothetical protein